MAAHLYPSMQQFLAMCNSTPWDTMGMKETVDVTAPRINELIKMFEDRSEDCDGVAIFQDMLLLMYRATGLSADKWVPVTKAGVHPDNRERAGLIAVDVHELLFQIFFKGWS